jgi:hypothetical protein
MATIKSTFGAALGTVDTTLGMIVKGVRITDRWLDAAVAGTENHVGEIERKYEALKATQDVRALEQAAAYQAEHMADIEERCKDPNFRHHYEAAIQLMQPKLRVAAE